MPQPQARRRWSLRQQLILGVVLVQVLLMAFFIIDLLGWLPPGASPPGPLRIGLHLLLAVLLGAGLAWLVSRSMTRSLDDMLSVAQRMRAGQLDAAATPPDAVNKVDRMAAAFNVMLETLVDRERSLKEANAALEARVAERTAELAESEAVTRSILEHANDAFVQMDQHGRVTAWNDMAHRTFGWRPAEAIGRPLAELIIPPPLREAHQQGLARYLATGVSTLLVDRRVELTACAQDGHELPVEISLRVRRRGDACFFDAFVRDITERKQMELALELQATTDALTGLANRRSLLKSLPLAMRRAQRTGRALALIFLDLDGFKSVNDNFGHEAGDRVLIEFARRLRVSVRETDTPARLAGDEFVVILENLVSSSNDGGHVAQKILIASQVPYEVRPGQWLPLSASIGVSVYAPEEGDGVSAEDLLARSDEAMYRSKHRGKGRVSVWADL
ncbi:diguanylate cyclase [Pelomonas sp. KK5]|uniref:diguanylate cyclase n=1 Tax=Pelomonas sp. KK5 TaxID=1855730 RepID=UPI00097BC4B0|nr:diguanylate cyclase [Pelomonas sp. KK5]